MIDKMIEGVIPPMLTPFAENGDVDFEAHVHNMEKWNQDKLSGYLVLGSNSETSYLNEEEKVKLVKLTVKNAEQDRIILAGTGMESAQETISFTNKVADMGVDGALILTPSYYHAKMNTEAQISFFTHVADNTRIPVLIYNVPAFTHINIAAQAVATLSQHPNIIGMKDSSGNVPQLADFQRVMDKNFNLMVGTVSAWYPALTLGIRAGIFASANCLPNQCNLIQEAFDANEFGQAKEMYRRIFPVNTAVTATYGIAGLKYVSDVLGYNGGFVRNPLLPLKKEEEAKINAILKTAELT